jgi:serine/threonine protein phosphatase 1
MLRTDLSGHRHWARAPAGTRIYAIGDLHGRLDLLDEMHDLIRTDVGAAPRGQRRLVVYLGDYIDRGPRSCEIVARMLDNPMSPDFETVYLRGNHEDIMLGFLDFGTRAGPWLRHGGRETLQSYGLDAPHHTAEDEFPAAREALDKRLPPTHRAFLDATKVMHREGDYLFVHAGIRPGVKLEKQDPNDFMWIRHEFLDSEAKFGVCVVHGHTIEARPAITERRIGLDTGAYSTGVLSCAVIEDDTVRFLQTAPFRT